MMSTARWSTVLLLAASSSVAAALGCGDSKNGFDDTSAPGADAGARGDAASDASNAGRDGAGDAGSNPGTGDGGTTADASSCHPPSLHAPSGTDGVFCPFSGVDGGRDLTCARVTQQCCETPNDDAGASTCQAVGSACPAAGSTTWECEDTVDCAAGKVCCGAVTLEQDPVCGYFRAAPGFGGTHCKASCGAGEVVVCQQQSGCTTGTCTPFRAAGNAVGACR